MANLFGRLHISASYAPREGCSPMDFDSGADADEVVNRQRVGRGGRHAAFCRTPTSIEQIARAVHGPRVEAVEPVGIEARPVHEVRLCIRGVLQALDLFIDEIRADRRTVEAVRWISAQGSGV
jgi:hypothetical protein